MKNKYSIQKVDNEYLQTLTDYNIIEETIKQIEKDFGEFSIVLNLVQKVSPYTDLMNCLTPVMAEIIGDTPAILPQLLYRIDLSEIKLKQAISNKSEDQNDAEIISDLIIKRELQKVLTRRHFSGL